MPPAHEEGQLAAAGPERASSALRLRYHTWATPVGKASHPSIRMQDGHRASEKGCEGASFGQPFLVGVLVEEVLVGLCRQRKLIRTWKFPRWTLLGESWEGKKKKKNTRGESSLEMVDCARQARKWEYLQRAKLLKNAPYFDWAGVFNFICLRQTKKTALKDQKQEDITGTADDA
jgi:hypothetical protein